jgi:predicted ATPase
LGYEYKIIPNGTIQQRVDYILNEIQWILKNST